jgi:hypothetical protein
MNDRYNICKETIMIHLKVLSRQSLEETGKNHENIITRVIKSKRMRWRDMTHA